MLQSCGHYTESEYIEQMTPVSSSGTEVSMCISLNIQLSAASQSK